MPFFQTSVLKKYLSQQNTAKITAAYAEYSAYFHNSTIQENIGISKYKPKFSRLIRTFVKPI